MGLPSPMLARSLGVDGFDTMRLTYRERRRLLEELELDGPYCSVPETFEDGAALFDAVCERGLEGVVAKKLTSRTGRGSARG